MFFFGKQKEKKNFFYFAAVSHVSNSRIALLAETEVIKGVHMSKVSRLHCDGKWR